MLIISVTDKPPLKPIAMRRCYVNPMTCQHKPFLANNGQVSQAWDSCLGPGLNTTIDAGEILLRLLSKD